MNKIFSTKVKQLKQWWKKVDQKQKNNSSTTKTKKILNQKVLATLPEILKTRIANTLNSKDWANSGYVLIFSDGIVISNNLSKAAYGELVQMSNAKEIKGLVMSLFQEYVSVGLLSDNAFLGLGDRFERTQLIASIPNSGWFYLSRIVNSLGLPVDGKGSIKTLDTRKYRIDIKAPGIINRGSVKEPIITGVKAVDSMIPIGRGQRELIIGDRQTGKTAIAMDTILAQRSSKRANIRLKRVFCIYVMIGQKKQV